MYLFYIMGYFTLYADELTVIVGHIACIVNLVLQRTITRPEYWYTLC